MKKSNMKKLISMVSIVLVIMSFTGCISGAGMQGAFTEKEEAEIEIGKYTDENGEKIMLSDAIMAWSSWLVEPGLDSLVKSCDIAVSGRITKIEEVEKSLSINPQLDEKMLGAGKTPSMTFTMYTVEVDNYLIGDGENEITVQISGGLGKRVTKPLNECGVVFFLTDITTEEYFTGLMYEHGIMLKHSDGTLYSLSNAETLAVYDGKTEAELIEDVKALAEKYGRN